MADIIKRINDFLEKGNDPQPPKEPSTGCLWTGTVLSGLVGIPFTLMGIFELIQGLSGIPVIWILTIMVFFGFIPMGISGLFWRAIDQKQKKYQLDYAHWLENNILKYSMHEQGRITAAEVAVHLNISTEFAEKTLDQMVNQNLMDISISEKGVKVYHVRGLGENKNNVELL